MISVNIIGTGRVAHHLVNALHRCDNVEIRSIAARDAVKRSAFAKAYTPPINTTSISALLPADVTIIAVTDDAITEVSEQLTFTDALVVHTSGSAPIAYLSAQNRAGVFYPLQTFSKNKEVHWQHIPICLETEEKKDIDILKSLAKCLDSSVYVLDSHQRSYLHLSAVFANNFANHCFTQAHQICKEHQIPFELLHPLILETAQKAVVASPLEAQTGPALRNDQKTIRKQRSLLTGGTLKLYKLLTKSIKKTHGKKL